MKNTLTIILGLTRETNLTYSSSLSKALIPLEIDLVFSVSSNSGELGLFSRFL